MPINYFTGPIQSDRFRGTRERSENFCEIGSSGSIQATRTLIVMTAVVCEAISALSKLEQRLRTDNLLLEVPPSEGLNTFNG
jgi:hypothetical protein